MPCVVYLKPIIKNFTMIFPPLQTILQQPKPLVDILKDILCFERNFRGHEAKQGPVELENRIRSLERKSLFAIVKSKLGNVFRSLRRRS